MPVPQRLRVFLWVVCCQKLMTNLERCNCHIGLSSLCPSCFAADESIFHVLRDCHVSAKDWVLSNIRSQLSRKFRELPWPYLFISTLWHLWKGRNDLVFNNAQSNSGCICLNVDGAVSMVSNSGAIGGLLQDHYGSWISGFQKSIGKCSPFQVELWVIFTGLNYTWDQGFTILQIQSDSKDVIMMLNIVQTVGSVFPLVRAIAKLRQKRWVIDIVWVPHDGNRAADILVKLTDPSALDIIQLQSSSERLHPILHSDAHEVSFTQF
ncbi:hypothetical protein GQ457_01G027580 [Hibiscus cannabinus]